MQAGTRVTKAGLTLGWNRNLILKATTAAAAGTNQATATDLVARMHHVTAADGTKGVKLPAITAEGQIVVVYNATAASGLKVYPATGAAINGGTANAAVTIEGKTMAFFVASSTTNWGAIFTADT